MNSNILQWIAACSIVFMASVSNAGQIIPGVPSYTWHNGCGPTAVGMIVGYWDALGYGDLIPGSNDYNTNLQAINDMMASPGQIRDYGPTPDRIPTPDDLYHLDNSVADFMETSRNPLGFGWAYESMQSKSLSGYSLYKGYNEALAGYSSYTNLWTTLIIEIDARRPMELFVDSTGNGIPDHFVTAIGYNDTTKQYACYNTYDHAIHWYQFAKSDSNYAYGVWSGMYLKMNQWKGTGDYNNSSNWVTGQIPNTIGAAADFHDNITGATIVGVASNITVGKISFFSTNSYTITGLGHITLNSLDGNARIISQIGNHTISVSVRSVNNTVIDVESGSLILSGTIDSPASIIKTGPGQLIIGGNLIARDISVEAGNFSIDGGNAIVHKVVNNGEVHLNGMLAGDDGNRPYIDVTNNGMLYIEGILYCFGNLDGIGKTIVRHGSVLWAKSLDQDSILIETGAEIHLAAENYKLFMDLSIANYYKAPEPTVFMICLIALLALLVRKKKIRTSVNVKYI